MRRLTILPEVIGVKRLALYCALGLLPSALFFFGYVLYWLVTATIEVYTDLRFPHDLNFQFRTTGMIGAAGLIIGTLFGFVRLRSHFGFVQRYLFLFAFGLLVPLLASVVQYHWYRSDRTQFVFDDTALTTVGRLYTDSMHATLGEEAQYAAELALTVRRVLAALEPDQLIHYMDPFQYWEDGSCRRFTLHNHSEALCVERETTVTPHTGVSYSYWPIIHKWGNAAYNDVGFRVDHFFLTGPFRCPVPNDLTGGGGFNFLRHEQVDAEKLMAFLEVTAEALESRSAELSQRLTMFDQGSVMPYWYFFFASVLGFVGSDFLLVQPVGFWPVTLGVVLAVFRYLYFAVLVAIFLEPIADRLKESKDNKKRHRSLPKTRKFRQRRILRDVKRTRSQE